MRSAGPLLPRRRLGTELRRLRGDRTLDEVAEATMISTSKLSRLENGQGVPQPRDIRDLINFYELDPTTADRLRRLASAGRQQAWWREEYRDVLSDPLDAYLDFESGASTIRTYAALVVPGLLQTRSYATDLLRALKTERTDEQVARLAEIKKRRQHLLHDNNSPTRFHAIIDEAALHRTIGAGEDTWLQLDRLRELSQLRNVTIQIIPFDRGAHAGLMGMFTIFQFADDMSRDIVSLETQSGDRYLEAQSDVYEYLRIFDSLSHKALDEIESRSLLTKVMSDFPSPKEQR